MRKIALSIQNLSKVYRIDPVAGGAASRTLGEDISHFVRRSKFYFNIISNIS